MPYAFCNTKAKLAIKVKWILYMNIRKAFYGKRKY